MDSLQAILKADNTIGPRSVYKIHTNFTLYIIDCVGGLKISREWGSTAYYMMKISVVCRDEHCMR